jgi:hypothetical protein
MQLDLPVNTIRSLLVFQWGIICIQHHVNPISILLSYLLPVSALTGKKDSITQRQQLVVLDLKIIIRPFTLTHPRGERLSGRISEMSAYVHPPLPGYLWSKYFWCTSGSSVCNAISICVVNMSEINKS